MAFKTMGDITQSVLNLVGLVSGSGVQLYTEPQVRTAIQLQFDSLYIKRFWEWMTDWHTVTLSGTGGLVTGSMATFLGEYQDIDSIYVSATERRVVPPRDREHMRVSGSNPLYYTPLMWDGSDVTAKVIKFWPPEAVGSVDIRCRTKPGSFVPASVVPFPSVVMEPAAAWHLLDNDGINPTAAQKAQLLYETAYRDVIANASNDVIGFGGARTHVPVTIRTL
jgi:hypothetical protein